jgi:glucosamine--fructose-6-phosphate aminotransferase (isomerizing)
LALIAPENSELAQVEDTGFLLPLVGYTNEAFSPLLATLPSMLFAASRSVALNEPYFRAFTGGRSIEGGGGISRIRTSQRIRKLIR